MLEENRVNSFPNRKNVHSKAQKGALIPKLCSYDFLPVVIDFLTLLKSCHCSGTIRLVCQLVEVHPMVEFWRMLEVSNFQS